MSKQLTYYHHRIEQHPRVSGRMRYRANVSGRTRQTIDVTLWEARGDGVWASQAEPAMLTVSLPVARHVCALLNDQLERMELGEPPY